MKEEKINLLIKNLTVSEASKITSAVREIDNQNPDRAIFIQVMGFEDKPVAEAAELRKKIFPSKKNAG